MDTAIFLAPLVLTLAVHLAVIRDPLADDSKTDSNNSTNNNTSNSDSNSNSNCNCNCISDNSDAIGILKLEVLEFLFYLVGLFLGACRDVCRGV